MTTKCCACCGDAKSAHQFGRDKNRPDGLNPYCKACARAKSADYFAANPDKVRETKNAYCRRNAERIRRWRRENAERLRAYWKAYGREYRKLFKAETAEKTRRQQAARRRAVPNWFDADKAAAVYAEAMRLRAEGKDVEVDHIFPISGLTVCGLHWHGNLQIIPSAANRSKGNKVCPDAAPLAAFLSP